MYHSYVDLPRLWGLSVLDDQLIAGLIMKLGGGAVLWIAITVIFFSWAAEEERAKGPPRYTSVSPGEANRGGRGGTRGRGGRL